MSSSHPHGKLIKGQIGGITRVIIRWNPGDDTRIIPSMSIKIFTSQFQEMIWHPTLDSSSKFRMKNPSILMWEKNIDCIRLVLLAVGDDHCAAHLFTLITLNRRTFITLVGFFGASTYSYGKRAIIVLLSLGSTEKPYVPKPPIITLDLSRI